VIAVTGCGGRTGPEVVRVEARPESPPVAIEPGEHALGLGGKRDGTLYIPKRAGSRTPLPLLVLMHGGGQAKELFRFTFPLAEELGVVILTLDSRDNTWDGVDSPFGPDVVFIDTALRHTFRRVAVDPRRLALGGFSDGASYALSLGLVNGDLFTHLVAFAPGFIASPAPPAGMPRIFIAHGTRDNVLGIDLTSRRFVPRLKSAGYDVTYQEFDGPHNTPPPIARKAMEWLVAGS
jgi:phospholipase/carboxylesterase